MLLRTARTRIKHGFLLFFTVINASTKHERNGEVSSNVFISLSHLMYACVNGVECEAFAKAAEL